MKRPSLDNSRKLPLWKKIVYFIVIIAIVLLVLMIIMFSNLEKELPSSGINPYQEVREAIDSLQLKAPDHDIFTYEDLGILPLTEEKDSTAKEIQQLRSAPSKKELKARIKLFRNRYKECEKGKIVKGTGRSKISIDGLDIRIHDKKIIGLGSMNITPTTMEAITQKVTIIDDILYQNCVDLGREYSQVNPNPDIIILLITKKYEWQNRMVEVINNIKESTKYYGMNEVLSNSIDTLKITDSAITK